MQAILQEKKQAVHKNYICSMKELDKNVRKGKARKETSKELGQT